MPEKKVRESKQPKRNNLNCFQMKETSALILVIVVFMLPFVNILLLRNNNSYNVIDWEEYYRDQENYRFYIDGAVEYDPNGNNQQVRYDTTYFQIPLRMGDTDVYKNVTYASNNYQIVGGDNNITFVSEYSFDATTIYHYYPFLMGLPLSFLKNTNPSSGNDSLIEVGSIIPSNWTDVWDNIDIYFYYADEDGEGVGYRFGKDEWDGGEPDRTVLDTNYGRLDLDVYNLNVSGEINWDLTDVVDVNGTVIDSKYFPRFTYHSKPVDENGFIYDYLKIVYGSIGDPVAEIEELATLLPIEVFLQSELVQYDNSLIEIYQINGCPLKNQVPPVVGAVKCGYYIRVGEDFDIKSYYNEGSPDFDIEQHFVNSADHELVNGISVFDGGLWLGRTITVYSILRQTVLYDIIIVFSAICVISIVYSFLKYPEKYPEYKKLSRSQCLR